MNVSRKEYINDIGPYKLHKQIDIAAIAMYICAGLTLILRTLGGELPVDCIIFILLGVWIHVGKSLAGGIVAVVYCALTVVASLVATKTLSGGLMLLISIFALVCLCKGNKLWKAYLRNPTPAGEDVGEYVEVDE